jgi:Amino acid synthesis
MIDVRRIFTQVEEIRHEFGPPPEKPLLRGIAAAVLTNPYAGRYESNIVPFMDELEPLGVTLATRLIQAMGVKPAEIEGYGKGAIIGAAGELEHGALWHAPGGYAMRRLLESSSGAKAIVPSAKKVGAPGANLDVPITHINASYVRSHFDAIEVHVPGAPSADEIVLILAMTTGSRIHARAGGLRKEDVKGDDGLR